MAKSRFASACVFALCIVITLPASAQTLAEVIPAKAAHCALTLPPPQAGLAATPGGFVMVFPRNDALTDGFTGCKLLWVVDGEKTHRFATLYFKGGKLAVAVAHDVRDSAGTMAGACAFPERKSLLAQSGQRMGDAGCAGFTGDSLYALRLPTWPRSCLTAPQAAVCVAEPR